MQINVCDHHTDRSVLAAKYLQECACRCMCLCTHTHGCTEVQHYPVCFSNLGDLCLEYCNVLGGISGNSQPYVLIFTHLLFLPHTHLHTRTHKLLLNTKLYTHNLYQTHVHWHTHHSQPKGQGHKKSVCRFESMKHGG